MDVLVIGAGVVGLTTAISLAEAGLSVTIRTAALPGQTTSAAAGAVWGAVKAGPPDRVLEWGRIGFEALAKLAAEPGTGVRIAAGREVSRAPLEPYYWTRLLTDLRACEESELPDGFTDGWHYTAPLATMPVYLDYLRARFERAGGMLEVSPVASLAGLAGLAPVDRQLLRRRRPRPGARPRGGTGPRAGGDRRQPGHRGVPHQPGPRAALDRVHVPARGHHPARRHERRGELRTKTRKPR